MASDIRTIDFKEFVDEGFLQEANRQFFHPLGLAISVEFNEDGEPLGFGGIWDYRDDPEGLYYDPGWMKEVLSEAQEKAAKVQALRDSKSDYRQEHLGFDIQPVDDGE